MAERTYISVILPLRLEWEPVYWTMEEDVHAGQAVRAALHGREYVGIVGAAGVAPNVRPAKIMGIIGVEPAFLDVSPGEIALWRKIADYYMCTVGEVFKSAYPPGLTRPGKSPAEKTCGHVRGAVGAKRKGDKNAAESAKESAQGAINEVLERPKLTQAQKRAEGEILKAFAEGKTALLNGVTGSGKTEIYISLALRALSEGKNVLYLVPEIALSRQLENRLRKVFGTKLLVYHSGETPAKRRAVLAALRTCGLAGGRATGHAAEGNHAADHAAEGNHAAGHATEGNHAAGPDARVAPCGNYIVLGTRSAVLLPHSGLGLAIVDEEQDASYKQDAPAPHYNGRDTALMLASVQKNCNVVLGSATPSLESLYNCRIGKYREVRLNERYYAAENSDVEIIDTVAERRKRGMKGSFSLKLISLIQKCIDEGGQAMILRTRRGYSPVIQCTSCGRILRCPHCNVSLTYHKEFPAPETDGFSGKINGNTAACEAKAHVGKATQGKTAGGKADEGKTTDIGGKIAGKVICHHCGHSTVVPPACPECGGSLVALGSGTQKIEEEAAALFPKARIARLDSDIMQSRKAEKEIITKFSKGEIDILIGTQVVAKGFDFEKLSLVAVLQSDAMLGAGDFRADEKTLHTLVQFRGRCGRRDRRGLFVIQTARPDHPVYRSLLGGGEDSPSNESHGGDGAGSRETPSNESHGGDGTGSRETPSNESHGDDAEGNCRAGITETLLAERREFGYPPYTRLINILVRHAVEDVAEKLAGKFALELANSPAGFHADGPFSPPLDKEGGLHVRMIRLSLERDRDLSRKKRELQKLINAFEQKEQCPGCIATDVDPS